MKNGWDIYATKKRLKQKGYFRKCKNRGSSRETSKASCCNCIQQSREVKEEVDQSYGKVVWLTGEEEFIYIGEENESSREEDVSETHQEGRQRIQESDQGRCETEKTDIVKTKRKVGMKKQTIKERKHEAKETKAYEKKEDKKESKGKKK